MFNPNDYNLIHEIVFSQKNPFPGYRPTIIESPNGDSYWDTEKRYAHVAKKYFTSDYVKDNFESFKVLNSYLEEAHKKSLQVAEYLGIPEEYHPDIEYGALRILEYPPGSVTHPHKDFDLFTLMCYRDIPETFKYLDENKTNSASKYQDVSQYIHFGEILELLAPEYPATMHEVVADSKPQHSIVYFTIPNHSTLLPTGETVKEWLDERLSRSRKEVTA